jgi:hypothetical protein
VRTDAIQAFVTQETPIVRITLRRRREGVGYTYTIGTGGSSVVALLRDHLAPKLIGRDPDASRRCGRTSSSTRTRPPSVRSRASRSPRSTRRCGICAAGARLPLWKAAGGAQPQGSGLHDEGGGCTHARRARREAVAAKKQGFRGAKMKVGKPHVSEDVARSARCAKRSAMRSRSWSMRTSASPFGAIRGSRVRAASARLARGAAAGRGSRGTCELAAHTAIPIAVGESIYHPAHFREYLERDAVRSCRSTARASAASRRGSRSPCGRVFQRRGVPAFPDGIARVAHRGGSRTRVGRIHSAAH